MRGWYVRLERFLALSHRCGRLQFHGQDPKCHDRTIVSPISNSTTKFNILWNSLSYPNVLNLVGIAGNMKWYQFTTVSEWVVHGYTGKNATNRLELVGVSGFQWFPINPSNSCVVQWKG